MNEYIQIPEIVKSKYNEWHYNEIILPPKGFDAPARLIYTNSINNDESLLNLLMLFVENDFKDSTGEPINKTCCETYYVKRNLEKVLRLGNGITFPVLSNKEAFVFCVGNAYINGEKEHYAHHAAISVNLRHNTPQENKTVTLPDFPKEGFIKINLPLTSSFTKILF